MRSLRKDRSFRSIPSTCSGINRKVVGFPAESLDGMLRNQWSTCSRMTGRLGPEYEIIETPDGNLSPGMRQLNGVCSPLLANIFIHHAFDEWMRQNHPDVLFERYADDALVHCKTAQQAKLMRSAIEKRLAQCKLELHPEKTQIVYCKDDDRRKEYCRESFDFLGYTFRPRRAKSKRGKYFVSFLPAISNKAKGKIRKSIREWRIHLITWTSLENIAEKINPILRGWYQYYGRFYKSEMYPVLRNVERYLILWARWKYKRLSSCAFLKRFHMFTIVT